MKGVVCDTGIICNTPNKLGHTYSSGSPPTKRARCKTLPAQDGVPTSALERICRYATDRTAGSTVANPIMSPPFLNPGVATGKLQLRDSSKRNIVICRRGALRRTAFFVAEGEGEVFVNSPNRDLGCGSAWSVWDAGFGGGDLSGGHKRRRRGRQKHLGGGDSVSDIIVVSGSNRTLGAASPVRSSGREPDDRVVFIGYERVKDSPPSVKTADVGEAAVNVERTGASGTSRVEGGWGRGCSGDGCSGDEWWANGDEKGHAVAVLSRGDFFGVAPELQTTQEVTPMNTLSVHLCVELEDCWSGCLFPHTVSLFCVL